MPLKRRGKWYYISEMINGVLVREALGTKDHRQAKPYSHIRRKALDQVALLLEPTRMQRSKSDDQNNQAVSAQITAQTSQLESQVIDYKGKELVGATGLEPVTPAV